LGYARLKEFGPVVAERPPFAASKLIFVYKPDDVRAMFNAEGEFPSR
jgi:hypothetical protein